MFNERFNLWASVRYCYNDVIDHQSATSAHESDWPMRGDFSALIATLTTSHWFILLLGSSSLCQEVMLTEDIGNDWYRLQIQITCIQICLSTRMFWFLYDFWSYRFFFYFFLHILKKSAIRFGALLWNHQFSLYLLDYYSTRDMSLCNRLFICKKLELSYPI